MYIYTDNVAFYLIILFYFISLSSLNLVRSLLSFIPWLSSMPRERRMKKRKKEDQIITTIALQHRNLAPPPPTNHYTKSS